MSPELTACLRSTFYGNFWLTCQAVFIKRNTFVCLCFQFLSFVKQKFFLMRILSMGDKISKLMSGLFSCCRSEQRSLRQRYRNTQIDIISGENIQESFVCVTLSNWDIVLKLKVSHESGNCKFNRQKPLN